ncbi:type 1 fimbrial protein [Salmonella enterica subsp. enterica]|nr:type 1 fimbrial protein [Salmonella enterica subsp. enterica]
MQASDLSWRSHKVKLLTGTMLLIMMTYSFADAAGKSVSSDVDFNGTLVAEPCVVAPGSDGENVAVDFGTIPDKTFYSIDGRRTWIQSFHILLTECDLSLSKEVNISFTGVEDAEQPGLLAVNSSSGVKHVAIGLQTHTGEDLPLNKQMQGYLLNNGTTQLNFKAYVQASDEGVTNHNVGHGAFESISTFELEYP